MAHLFLISLSFILLSIWYVKPKIFLLVPAAFVTLGFAFNVLLNDTGFSTQLLIHFSLDMLLMGIHLLILQAYKHTNFAMILALALSMSFSFSHKIIHTHLKANVSDNFNNPELLIAFKDHSQIKQFLSKYHSEIVSHKIAFDVIDSDLTHLDDYYTIDIKNDINVNEFIIRVKKEINPAWIEINQKVELPILQENTQIENNKKIGFNDPLSGSQWSLDLLAIDRMQENLAKIKTAPKKKITIAILDTGIDASHEDIVGRYKSSGIKSNDKDTKGHGTHCAGIAAAITNNGTGIASILPANLDIEVMSIKVLNNMGFGTQQTIINGIIKAADLGADVISLSLGGMSSETKERAYTEAVKYANDKNAIVIVAAGNSSKNAKFYSPANTKGVIAVTAIDNQMKKAVFANNVEELDMGIAAPGVDILSTFPRNQYKTFSGTSMAAPFVAGMVAIIKAYNPNMTTEKIYQLMISGAFSVQDFNTPIIFPEKIVDAIEDES